MYLKTGHKINGITITGFKTTGKPKITGSLIPKTQAKLPTYLTQAIF